MIKHYCDKCGKLLGDKDKIIFYLRARIGLMYDFGNLEYCKDCFIVAVGEERYKEALTEDEERRARIAARKAETKAKRDACKETRKTGEEKREGDELT